MKKVVIISGPTASGKTDLSYSIGKIIPTVLLNADSRHVYKSLDIISGKDLPDGSEFTKETFGIESPWNIGHYTVEGSDFYLLDVAHPSQTFSIHDYSELVRQLLPALSSDKIPVIVGGSNFYIASLRDSIETTAIPPNNKLRDSLSKHSVSQLQKTLQEIDTNRLSQMNNSDRNNSRRLIRAIEVGKWKQTHTAIAQEPVLHKYEVLHIALTAPLDLLREKIDARVDSRLSQGALQEAEKLFKNFDELSQNVRTANGYMQLFEYFSNTISYEDAIQKWKYSEYHNAKKQLTWIHGDSRIKKYSITDQYYIDNVLHDVLNFMS